MVYIRISECNSLNCEKSRLTARLQNELIKSFPNQWKRTTESYGEFYWKQEDLPDSLQFYRYHESDVKREIKDYPSQEIAVAGLCVMRGNIALEQEDWLRKTSKLLGFSLNINVKNVIETGLHVLIRNDKIRLEQNKIILIE